MRITLGKLLATLFALGATVFLHREGMWINVPRHSPGPVGLLIVLVVIWFPDELDELLTDYTERGQAVHGATPGCLISALGWFLLLGVPLTVFLIRRYGS
ncbi:MAG: hypothetical protein M5U26_04660 [Planctomycetota bacterium]|nr:hypothetical protein [Planctomycetota bacterium]